MREYQRRLSREVTVGNVTIGGSAPIVVQSMTKTDTRDIESTIRQIESLTQWGCELVRLAVPNQESADALAEIKKKTPIPLVADIHFDYRLALKALEAGADKLRINPGNIGSADRLRQVVKGAKERGVPIRVGVNAGSLEKKLLQKYGYPTAEAMVESALTNIRVIEDMGYEEMVVSLKAPHVVTTCRAYQMLAERVDYPFHLGITEAGTSLPGAVRSAVGLGILLSQGLGDTIRVSLTAPPEEEVKVAYHILQALNLRQRGPMVVSCPTCGRCEVDLVKICEEVEKGIAHISYPLHIAIMGCVVNGPGEARLADLGFAGGKDGGVLFRKGKILRKVKEEAVVKELLREIDRLVKEMKVLI
ncbi:MAG: flavodoxin-dependent (E)-4-hydroxy-3-methylbut-2-enyl-diphosphate synthase [Candidatus Aminicenantes bacterium]|nr:flavodoxin-dependent (E)-4-hydroxy-3-methylbut-2-enyl-diphosphate synthase [Candidatus Aminicenantes bacterium]